MLVSDLELNGGTHNNRDKRPLFTNDSGLTGLSLSSLATIIKQLACDADGAAQ
jgi:hypothetical protein